ncbi:MAG: nickel pincer cofactor biosynthesis protein LarC [Clostridia bacterium]|nr:nickel pincer cofactor biosynthesis protein LarC [Clostridia bacterium]
MKTLYLECGMGAAGDMLTAALLELMPDREAMLGRLNALGLPGVVFEAEPAEKCGVTGTHMRVTVQGQEEESEDVHDLVLADAPVHDHDSEQSHHHNHPYGEGHNGDGHGHHGWGNSHRDEHDGEGHGHNGWGQGHSHGDEHDGEGHGHHGWGNYHGDEHDGEGHGHHHGEEHGHFHGHDHAEEMYSHAEAPRTTEHEHEHWGHEHHDEHGHHHHHVHSSLADIDALIRSLDIPESVKEDACAVYQIIAQAEGQVHGKPMDQIHFHEVGTMDAVADVVAVCLLMHEIGADRVCASPVHVGAGYVRCMHGVLPVPAPATALILEGIPTYGGRIEGELCTPTGAALLRHFVSAFGDRPEMATEAIGYGMGMKDFERANCVRAFLGETLGEKEKIVKLECNLDDMTGEALGFAMERLFDAGARDVYWQTIGMKKNRPGILLSVISMPEDADMLAQLMLKYTTTLGVRRENLSRYVLNRKELKAETTEGEVRVKIATGYGISKWKAEYEDLAAIAKSRGIRLEEVLEGLKMPE